MLVFAVLLDKSGITAAQGEAVQPPGQSQSPDGPEDSGETVEEARREVGAGVSHLSIHWQLVFETGS
eukprot:COSAG02_NODE_2948_length_7680_cov_7.843029_2_plen_67_part_00